MKERAEVTPLSCLEVPDGTIVLQDTMVIQRLQHTHSPFMSFHGSSRLTESVLLTTAMDANAKVNSL